LDHITQLFISVTKFAASLLFLNNINKYLSLSPSSIGTYCPSSDSCIGISKPVTGSINVVVSEVVEEDEDVDNKDVDS